MNYLRDRNKSDVKNHLARAVPRSLTPATKAKDSVTDAAAVMPVDETTERLAPIAENPVLAEVPEKTRPM